MASRRASRTLARYCAAPGRRAPTPALPRVAGEGVSGAACLRFRELCGQLLEPIQFRLVEAARVARHAPGTRQHLFANATRLVQFAPALQDLGIAHVRLETAGVADQHLEFAARPGAIAFGGRCACAGDVAVLRAEAGTLANQFVEQLAGVR